MKRVISLFLCILMATSMMMTTTWADETGFNKNQESETVRLLEAVGILMPKDEFVESNSVYITRAEMAHLLVCAMGYSETASKMTEFESIYRDVKVKTKYANEIIVASKLGYFGESLPAYFYPESRADADWAIKAMTRLLGYSQHMKKEPLIGYRLGLADGGVKGNNKYISRAGALQLLKNALEIPVFIAKGISTNSSVFYEQSANSTILSEYFGIDTRKGCLTANEFTAIKGEITEEGKLAFDGYIYSAPELETNDWVGMMCRFYTKKTDNGPVVVYIEKIEAREIILYSKNMKYSYQDNCYYTDNDNKTKKFQMDINTMVSYNGTPHFDKNKMHPASGHVVIIDNDMDNVYEVCKIREYRNVVVKNCDTAGGRIFDMTDQNRNLVFEDYDEVVIYSESGEKIGIEGITPNSVLTVYESIDKNRVEVYVTSRTLSRQLSKINTTKSTVTVEENDYVISDDCLFNPSDLKPGQMYYFYINYWNEIVYVKEDSSYFAFWLLDAIEETVVFDEFVWLKGLSETGEVMHLELAKGVVWNEYGNKRPRLEKSVVYNKLETSNVTNKQLLKLKLNDAGQVCEIVVAYDVQERSDLVSMTKDHPLIKMSYIVNDWPVYALYRYDATNPTVKNAYNYGEHFGHWMYFDSNAIEFQVETSSTTGTYTDDDMAVKKLSYRGTTHNIENFRDIYMSSKDNVAVEYAVKNLDDGVTDRNDGYYFAQGLVVDIENCMEEDTGVVVNKLLISDHTGWISEIYTTSEEMIERQSLIAAGSILPEGKNKVENGDIIWYNINKNNKIDEIRLLYDAKNNISTYPQTTLDAPAACNYGKVKRNNNGYMECEVAGGGLTASSILPVNIKKNLIEYNEKTEEIRAITPDEVYIGDDVVVISRYMTPYMTVIFREE